MSDAFSRYREAASGFTKVTRETAEKIIGGLVTPQELVETLNENRQAIVLVVRGETKRVVRRMGLATQDEVERLERQVADLRRRLREAEAADTKAPARKKTAKKKTGGTS